MIEKLSVRRHSIAIYVCYNVHRHVTAVVLTPLFGVGLQVYLLDAIFIISALLLVAKIHRTAINHKTSNSKLQTPISSSVDEK